MQDRIREQGAELWRWLQEGAQLYTAVMPATWPKTSTRPCGRSRNAMADLACNPPPITGGSRASKNATCGMFTDRLMTGVWRALQPARAPE